MLKKRLIPVLFLKNGFLVRSETFSYHQNLGNPVAQVERYNSWDVDELIYQDTAHPKRNFYLSVTDDERFLMLYASEASHGNVLYFKDMQQEDPKFININYLYLKIL